MAAAVVACAPFVIVSILLDVLLVFSALYS